MSATAFDSVTHPIRRSILRRLGEQGPGSLPELADAASVHVNTARPHVAELERAGLIEREASERRGRGRPAVNYRLAEDFTLPTADFLGLAELLAAAVVRSGQAPEDLRALGRDWGRWLLGRPGAQSVESELPRALERLGFHASVHGNRLTLTVCPCRLVLPDRPEVLCRLAIAVTEGILDGSGSGLTVAESVHDPERRVCSARLAEAA